VKKLGYNVIYQEGKGYGAAINTGLKNVAGDIIIIMDADGSANPKDIPRLLEKISEGYSGNRLHILSAREVVLQ